MNDKRFYLFKKAERLVVNHKLLSLFVISIVLITSALSIIYLFTPMLIGYQKTSNGIIEYFINSIDPSFIIKPYFHGNPVNALISVYVNLPNSIKFFEEYYGSSLAIPFSSLANYVKPWNRFKDVNTSLLVFVTYKMNNKTYSTAEEIMYNPMWILNDKPIQIISKINIPQKIININTTQIINKVRQIRSAIIKNTYPYCYSCGAGKNYPFIVNMSTEGVIEPKVPPFYQCLPIVNITYFYNLSIPLNWVTVSNNVNKYDKYMFITLTTALSGEVIWYAVSNSTYAGGPYIGVSYSANVNWVISFGNCEYFLSKLDYPTMYTYYNATIAVVTYQVEPKYYVTVFEVLWANPNKIGTSVETSNGDSCVIFTTSNGKHYYILPIGNGSVTYLFYLFNETNQIPKVVPYGYGSWNNGKISVKGEMKVGGMNLIYFTGGYLNQYVKNGRVAMVPFDIVDLLLTLIPVLNVPIDAGLTITVDFVDYMPFSSYTTVEDYFTYTSTSIYFTNFSSGQIYVSFLNYSVNVETPLLGFFLNYSTYYNG